jgi:hypothetical protein
MKVRCIDNSAGWEQELNIGQIYTVIKKIDGEGNHGYAGPRYMLKEIERYNTGAFVERFEIVSGCPCNVAGCLKHRRERDGT